MGTTKEPSGIVPAIPDEKLDELIAKEEAMLERLRGDKPTLRARLEEMHKRGDLTELQVSSAVDIYHDLLTQKLFIMRELRERRATKEMQWQIDERTVRDCPGNRTEAEWREAVIRRAEKLNGQKSCSKCKQEISTSGMRYYVTETESWLPSGTSEPKSYKPLPRGRWAQHASARTLSIARKLREFMGKRATIWERCKRQPKGGTSYKKWRR